MEDLHHTYDSLHKEHHAWRKYLIEMRAKLNHYHEKVDAHLQNSTKSEAKFICNELKSRYGLLSQEIENKLSSLSEIDGLMSKTKEAHHLVSSELFLINSRMRAGILEFDNGCNRFKVDVKSLEKG